MIYIQGWYLLASIVAFIFYGLDKHKARTDQWRIRENTLHLIELLGGWPGALIAQRYFHHKWKKTKFLVVFYAIVALHIAAWAAVIYLRCQ
jgi:uncharacterized membrane protein YsdA (DUF1294 family)